MYSRKKYESRIIDLSMPIYDEMPVYPGDPQVAIKIVHNYDDHSWQLRSICMGSHTGTHVDAFSHMDAEGENLDQIPLRSFFGPAMVVENTKRLPSGIGLLFSWAIEEEDLLPIMAAKPPFVGGELSTSQERTLLKNRILTYTNLVNIDLLPLRVELMFYGIPLKVMKGEGSPVRALAVINVNEESVENEKDI